MPASASWLIENEIIYISMRGEVTEEEVRALDSPMNAMLRATPYPVYIISDDSQIINQPTIRAFRRNPEDTESNYSTILSVGQKSPLQRVIAQTIARMFRSSILFFDTLPDALEHIYKQKPELRELEIDLQIAS